MTRNQHYVYILASLSRTLYVGITSNLRYRFFEHNSQTRPGFSKRYHVSRLVYFEIHADVRAAIAREKQIKGWLRDRKIRLIEINNPNWNDLLGDEEVG